MTILSKDLIGVKQSVVDEILLLNPIQIPMITLLGFGEAITNTRHEWYEDSMFATESTITAAATATDGTLKVANTEPFRKDLVIQVKDELIYVYSVNEVTKELSVTRGFANTTPAAIAVNTKATVMFVDSKEARDARDDRFKKRVPGHNITQVFDDSIKVSGTAESVVQYGIANQYSYEKAKKQRELALQLEQAIINGIEYQDGDKRYMRGIREYIRTNVTEAGNAPLIMDMINDLAQSLYERGAFKTGGDFRVIVGAKQKRAIGKFDETKIRLVRDDGTRGNSVDRLVTDFGEFPVELNNNLRPDELLLIDKNRAVIRPIKDRAFFHKYLGDMGDYTKGMIVGEYTLEFKQEAAHGRIKGLA
ncbi:SU10 major capsid protein [Brevibacillus formosus]|uniref:SU10 major capsid protein n=1 Tax=Brevibacillus formosus TaxID=54913 RepID=UPI003F197650